MNKASKNTEAMTTNLREWMSAQGWAYLTRANVMAYVRTLDLGILFELEVNDHMLRVFDWANDEAVAGMAGCMFTLGVTFEEDDWS